jgi:hypothetical protein
MVTVDQMGMSYGFRQGTAGPRYMGFPRRDRGGGAGQAAGVGHDGTAASLRRAPIAGVLHDGPPVSPAHDRDSLRKAVSNCMTGARPAVAAGQLGQMTNPPPAMRAHQGCTRR